MANRRIEARACARNNSVDGVPVLLSDIWHEVSLYSYVDATFSLPCALSTLLNLSVRTAHLQSNSGIL